MKSRFEGPEIFLFLHVQWIKDTIGKDRRISRTQGREIAVGAFAQFIGWGKR